ncbi:MAG: lamin tail domain-containing protein [Methanobacteriota archaeon]|nr:MAG: lamin tail domain-containing protein [Euryarchaeota archaeon]
MTRVFLFAGVLLLSAFTLQTLPSEAEPHQTIVLNEVVYNPRGPEVEGEWIELFNGGDSVNLQDWSITDQDNWFFQFPSLAVPQECYVVLHIGTGIPDSDFGDHVAHLYANKTTPRLNNNGDDLLLRDSRDVAVDFFSYGSGSGLDYPPPEIEWDSPARTAPEGYSSAVFPNGNHVDSSNHWIQSRSTPGESNGELSSISDELKIIEVYYNAHRDNEYVAITSISPNELDIAGWMITDLEGSVAFPLDTQIAPHGSLFIVRNSTSFLEDVFRTADFQYESGNAPSMINLDYIPQFNNDGDEVILQDDHGRTVDVFAYGYSGYNESGWEGEPIKALFKGKIAKRLWTDDCFQDTNTSSDWQSLREYGIGQSNFESEQVEFTGYIQVFSSPDTNFQVIADQLERAEESIAINLYEFTNAQIAQGLVSALNRGVSIRVLLEGSPVGGIMSSELEILDHLSSRGADIRLLLDDKTQNIHSRYNFNHGKYALIDGNTVLIGSENWGHSGLPIDNRSGNRGWGVLTESEVVHDYYLNVFEDDWNPQARDSLEYEQIRSELKSEPISEPASPSYEYSGSFPAFSKTGELIVRPAISPDTSLDESTILGMMRSAEAEILVEQFYIRPYWGNDRNQANPYLEEIVKASRRGVQVYVLLDSSWYNTEQDDTWDNDDMVASLNDLRETEGLPIEAKLIDADSHGLIKLHNKGLIVDGSEVLISSINWNKNSIASNREIGIIVYDRDVAAFFREIFFYDWKDDVTSPIAHAGEDRTVLQNDQITFDGNGSFDDIGIVNYSWDMDEDGIYEKFGPHVTYVFGNPGNHTINLRVEDAWGNVDTDTCLVSVKNREGTIQSGSTEELGGLVLLSIVTICVFVPAIFFVLGTKRKKYKKDMNS